MTDSFITIKSTKMNKIFIEIIQTFPTLFTLTVLLVELNGTFLSSFSFYSCLLAFVGLICAGIYTYHRHAYMFNIRFQAQCTSPCPHHTCVGISNTAPLNEICKVIICMTQCRRCRPSNEVSNEIYYHWLAP